MKKVKNFAFIHYVDRTHALAAIEAMHNEQVGGEAIEPPCSGANCERLDEMRLSCYYTEWFF